MSFTTTVHRQPFAIHSTANSNISYRKWPQPINLTTIAPVDENIHPNISQKQQRRVAKNPQQCQSRTTKSLSSALQTICGTPDSGATPSKSDYKRTTQISNKSPGNEQRTSLILIDCEPALERIPSDLVRKYSRTCLELNLKGNNLQLHSSEIQRFTRLQTLILDDNNLTNLDGLPQIPTLRVLWINNNQITDLHEFLSQVRERFPSLEYLSLLGNPVCPMLDPLADPEDVREYRCAVISVLCGTLRTLDYKPVSVRETEVVQSRKQMI